MKMKSTFKTICASALALSLAFCGYGALFPDRATFKPRVTHDVDFAFGVNLDKEQAFKVVDAYADLVFDTIKVYEEISDKEIAEAKGKIAAFKEDPFREAPGDVRAFLEKSGLRNVELYWAILSLESFEIVDETPQLGGFSLAVAGTIDLERFISALRQEESIKVSFEETQVEGERAWHIVPQKRDKEIERAHIDPYVASLDGRLVLVATSRDTLVKQIRLYRTGRGRGDALGGFSGVAGELAHLHVSHIGGLVRKYAPLEDLKEINQFVPDGDRLILGLEDLDVTDRVSPRGMLSSTLVLRTASEKDAETLRTLAKAGLMVLNAKIAHEPKVPDFVKKLVRDVKVGGMEGRFEVQSPLPLSTGCLILPAALFPVVSSAMLNANASTLSIQGRKIIIGIIQANIEREGKLGPVWPRTNVDGGGTDDIASHVSTSATDYFNALFDMEHYGTAEWDPVVDGELLSALSGAGVPGMSGRRLESRNVAWNIAANVTDETPDFMPVLISANFNPKLLAPGRFDGRDDTPLPIGPKSGAATSMFGDKAIVIVRKSGAAEVIKKKYLTRATLYNNQSFDISGSEKIPIKWLTPTGVVTPVAPDAESPIIEDAAPATRTVEIANGGDTTEKFTLESVLGRIEVVTTPPGAKISVDGKAVGTTRPQGDSALSQILLVENVSAGEHAVLAHLDGYYDQSLKVTVRAKETKQLPFTLRRGFTPDTEVELINGLRVSGLFKREDDEQVVLEIKSGVERPIPRANIRKVTSLRK